MNNIKHFQIHKWRGKWVLLIRNQNPCCDEIVMKDETTSLGHTLHGFCLMFSQIIIHMIRPKIACLLSIQTWTRHSGIIFQQMKFCNFKCYILSALKACARFMIFKLLWRAFYSTFLTWIASIHHKQNSGCEYGPGSAFFTQIVQNWRFHIFYGWIWCLVDEWAGSSLFFQWNAVFWACWAGTVLCRTSVFWVCNFVSLICCVPGTTVHQQCYLHAKWYNYNNRYKMQISSTNTPAVPMFHFCGENWDREDLYKLSLCFISSLWNIKATELCNSDFLSNCHFANWRKFEKIKSCKCQFWNWTHKNGG